MNVRFQRKWPPVRRETTEDVERDIADLDQRIRLSEVESESWAGLAKSRSGSDKTSFDDIYSGGSRSRSMRGQLAGQLEAAFTEEEKFAVVEHWIRKLMHGGRTQNVAERAVMRMLREIQAGGA